MGNIPPVGGRRDPWVRVHAVNIFVRDQDRSLKFFREQLGFDLAFDVKPPHGGRQVAVAPPDGSTVLMLVAPAPNTPQYQMIGRATQVTFVTDNVLARYAEWRQRGVQFQHVPRLKRIKVQRPSQGAEAHDDAPVWGGVFTRFRDVDGNSFSLVGLDDINRERELQRRAAAEKLEAERRAAQELEIAKEVQARLFPQTQPSMNTLEYAGVCIQARQVGGDYYDFLNLGGGRLGLVLADISGKGIAAALLMANLQANMRSLCATAPNRPEVFFRTVNEVFYDNTPENAYATLFFGEYDDDSRRFRYVNCGHLPALLLRSDGNLERLEPTAMVLGLFREWDCVSQECRLFPGDMVLLYTDGVTESFDVAGNEFGQERLVAALLEHRASCPSALLPGVVDTVRRFSPGEQQDDITLVAARCSS